MFLSHINDIPRGCTQPLKQFNNQKFLLNDSGEVTFGHNICPHQGSVIVAGRQSELKCRYHGWTWDFRGNPTSQGYTSVCNDTKLKLKPTYDYNGLLFDQPIDIPSIPVDFRGMQLKETRVDTVNASPKNIMNLFLDVDHIPVVHKGVYEQIGIDNTDIEWEYFNNGSIQKVRNNNKFSAFWIALYPHVMIEWQQGALFVTAMTPIEKNKTDVVVWKYSDDSDLWKLNESVWETAWAQDKEQAERLVGGSTTSNLEPQKIHFLNWTENAINAQ